MAAAQSACQGSAWKLQDLIIDIRDHGGHWDRIHQPLLSAVPLTAVGRVVTAPDISLDVLPGPADPPRLAPGARRSLGFGCRIVEHNAFTLVENSDSWFLVDAQQSHGTLCLHPQASSDRTASVLDLFLIGLNELLANFGLFDLHAAALSKDQVGLLLVGGSCTGKSTSAVALACQGWNYLSDDAVLVRSKQPVAAHGFRTVFSVDPDLVAHFPELDGRLGARMGSGTGKHLLDMRAVLPVQYVDSCIPALLVFTAIGDAAESALEPLGAGEAISRLIQQSPSLAFRRRHAAEQVALMSRLVGQSKSFVLRAGRDVLEDPTRLAQLIGDIIPPAAGAPAGQGH